MKHNVSYWHLQFVKFYVDSDMSSINFTIDVLKKDVASIMCIGARLNHFQFVFWILIHPLVDELFAQKKKKSNWVTKEKIIKYVANDSHILLGN
jgi:hypothetical protein